MNAKKFYATFVSLMLAIVMLMCTVVIVHADVYPGVPPYPAHPGKLLAVVGNVPGPGFYGGYWAMWDRIMPSLTSTIGFSSALFPVNYWVMPDDWSLSDVIWGDPGWQYSSQNINPHGFVEPRCWDLTSIEWRLMPTGMLWMDSLILQDAMPPAGRNIFPYLSWKSDELYWKYQGASVASERKHWIDEWQLELMRNPVMANVYFPYIYELYASYVNNFYGTVGWYDIDNLQINATKVNQIYNAGNMSLPERDRLLAGTLKYSVTEDWWNYNPAMIATYTEEAMANLITGTLYSLSLNPWPAPGTVPNPTNYYSKPDLAAAAPVVSPDGLRANITLKSGITWSDGVAFNATDVKYTLDLNLVPAAKAVGRGDFASVVKEINILGPLIVELVLHRPYNDLECILSNSWGLSILPEHYYRNIPVSQLRGHISNWDYATHINDIPYLGPFHLVESTTAYLKYVKHPGWWGNAYGYTLQNTVNEIYLEKVEDAWARFSMLVTHELDFAEHPSVPVQYFIALLGRADLTVFERPYVASNGVWFNFNNPYLSNRYVRLAISYAIPYDDIRANVLPSWGVSNWIAGGTFVHPWQYYGGIQLFNTVMPPYTYNPALAQAYLDMWKLSRRAHAPDAAVGPVGDADFNGLVELDDSLVWAKNYGNTEAQHTFLPGNDEDADFDNSDLVDLDDYLLWSGLTGTTYPPVAHDY